MNNSVSMEMLNAYIDNELDLKDAADIEQAIQNSVQLQQKLDELQQLKLKVQASYAVVRAPLHNEPVRRKNTWQPAALLAAVTLVLGVSSGWYGHQYLSDDELTMTALKDVNRGASVEQLLGVKLQPLKVQDDKIIIHLAQNDKLLFDKALAKAEALLARFDALEKQGRIQVLANSYGMDLMRKDKSPYQERIVKLMQQHNNIQFIACANTVKRLESRGVNVGLIEGVQIHGPVIDEIVSHMQDGWTYIKI